jgi:hypothetical protein
MSGPRRVGDLVDDWFSRPQPIWLQIHIAAQLRRLTAICEDGFPDDVTFDALAMFRQIDQSLAELLESIESKATTRRAA